MGRTFFQNQIKEHPFLRHIILIPLSFLVDIKQIGNSVARANLTRALAGKSHVLFTWSSHPRGRSFRDSEAGDCGGFEPF